ncbi:hypothetical protein BKA64DRAFT_102812 [Cadophora sp. MPI-SDFR-AT-0126]|nr:hypothetical protein BKA64DRAFT_102812 [Leotiomycetes sp. MPI-SDFR-AT-0126]
METFYDIKFSIIKEIRASNTARLCRDWVDRKVKMSYTIDGKPACSPLMALCSKYGGANCGDARDKIFGLHSLAESCCRAEIPVDYGLQLPQIRHRVLEHCITRHERWDSIIGASQSFHKQLNVPLLGYLTGTGGQVNTSDSWADITAVGYSTSSIIYVSPVGPGNLAEEKFKPISISRECNEELSKIPKLRSTYGPEGFQNHQVTRQFRLAVRLIPRLEYPFSATEVLQVPTFSSRRRYKLKKDDVLRILADAQTVTDGMSMPRPSIAICTSGVVYFVPDVTKPGDILCQVPSSDIVVIVRQWLLEPVGRAIPFLSNPAEQPSQFEPSPLDVQAMRKNRREVNLHLDLHTLQVLTAWSAT